MAQTIRGVAEWRPVLGACSTVRPCARGLKQILGLFSGGLLFLRKKRLPSSGLKGGACSALKLQRVLCARPLRALAVPEVWGYLRIRLWMVRTYRRRLSPARRCLSRALWCVRAHETLSLWQGRHEQ